MSGFIRLGVRYGLKYVAPASWDASTYVPKKVAKYLAKETGEYVRGVVRGKVKEIPLDALGTTTSTVTAAFTAGRQTTYIAKAITKKVVHDAPSKFVAGAKYLARTYVRDQLVTPAYVPIHFGYRRIVEASRAAGHIGTVEKYADKYVLGFNRRLNNLGLAPTPGKTITSVTRIAAYTGIYYGFHEAVRKGHEILDSISEYVPKVPSGEVVLPIGPAPSGNGNVLVPVVPNLPPVVNPNVGGNGPAPSLGPKPLPLPAAPEYVPSRKRVY